MKKFLLLIACQLFIVMLAQAQSEYSYDADSTVVESEVEGYKGLDDAFAEAFPELSKKDKPAYKKTSAWKWGKAMKITGVTLMSIGLTYTIVYGLIDAASDAIHEDDWTYSNGGDKTPSILYLPGAAAFGIGTTCFVLSYVLKHKAKKSVRLNSSFLPDLKKNGNMGCVPTFTLSYTF